MFLKYAPSSCPYCEDASTSIHKVEALWGYHMTMSTNHS